MNREKICSWISNSEKLLNLVIRSCISCGKDTKRYQKSFPIASKGVFTIAYPNKSQCLTLFQCFAVLSHQSLQKMSFCHKQIKEKPIILQTNRLCH